MSRPKDALQKLRDMMRRDGYVWWPKPGGKVDEGMWCAPGWEPDWRLNCPVYLSKPKQK
jgi:hypothetical protein